MHKIEDLHASSYFFLQTRVPICNYHAMQTENEMKINLIPHEHIQDTIYMKQKERYKKEGEYFINYHWHQTEG